MAENILFSGLAALMYWGTCRLFSAYDRRCLSRRLFVRVNNPAVWRLLGGAYRGRHRLPEEDWYKLSLVGLVSYAALFPVLLAALAAIFGWPLPWGLSGLDAAIWGAAVVAFNITDDIFGNILHVFFP